MRLLLPLLYGVFLLFGIQSTQASPNDDCLEVQTVSKIRQFFDVSAKTKSFGMCKKYDNMCRELNLTKKLSDYSSEEKEHLKMCCYTADCISSDKMVGKYADCGNAGAVSAMKFSIQLFCHASNNSTTLNYHFQLTEEIRQQMQVYMEGSTYILTFLTLVLFSLMFVFIDS